MNLIDVIDEGVSNFDKMNDLIVKITYEPDQIKRYDLMRKALDLFDGRELISHETIKNLTK